MKPIDTALLQRFLELAGERLEGDWVVIGGMVLPLLGATHRVTLDIDIAGPDEATMSQTLVLMSIAEELGLPVEAINQAGAYFLHKIEGWQDHLVEVHRGPSARIHVPDPTLFILLKLQRLTEADLADCKEMLRLGQKRGLPIDQERLLEAVGRALDTSPEGPRLDRLMELKALLEQR